MSHTLLENSNQASTFRDIEHILKKGKPTYEFLGNKRLNGIMNYMVELKRYYRALVINSWLSDTVTQYELTENDKLSIVQSMKADLETLKDKYPELNLDPELAILNREINRYLGTEV